MIGAGHVGQTIIDVLHSDHDITLIDSDPARVAPMSERYDVQTVVGSGASRRILQDAGIAAADLLFASTARAEINLVAAILAKRLSSVATIVRTTDPDYIEAWRERQIDVDFMVSSELETANAIANIMGVPAARHTDMFADGLVQMAEFDIPASAEPGEIVGRPLRDAALPPESRVACIMRDDRAIAPRGDEVIQPRDRVVVIGSPAGARAWSGIVAPGERPGGDIVVFGAGRQGTAIGRVLQGRGLGVRLVEPDLARARAVAEELPKARVYHSTGFTQEFLRGERIHHAAAAVFCTKDDAKNLYGAMLAKVHGVPFTIGLVDEPGSEVVFERAGADVAINPRELAAEEMVRFAHDPRIHQISMLEGDRFEILDITVRPDSPLANRPFRELPQTGTVIGALIRDGRVIFPHGHEMLRPGDRVIAFIESERAAVVERAL